MFNGSTKFQTLSDFMRKEKIFRMKGINEKVLAIILGVVVLGLLLFIGLSFIQGSKETANPLAKMILDLVGIFT